MQQLSRRFMLYSLAWFGLIVVAHYYVDFSLAYAIQRTFDPQSRFIAAVHWMSDFGYGWPYVVGFLLLFIVAYYRQRLPLALKSAYLWLCVVVSGLVCDLLKLLFGRPRPDLLFAHHVSHFIFLGHRVYRSSHYTSFPSGHATTAAVVGIGLVMLNRKWYPLSIALILVVSAARLLLLRHYLADVMAGMYLGGVTAWYLQRVFVERAWFELKGAAI